MDWKRILELGGRTFRHLGRSKGERVELQPGDPAPDFALRDHTGVEHRLADLRGQWVVLWFFPAAETPG